MFKYIFSIIIFGVFLISCNDNKLLSKIDFIKKVGDNNPKEAMKMLDSIYAEARNSSEYVMMKYDLLKIRLNDKSLVPPTSNHMVEIIVSYFEKKGNSREKQEAYYYAGSVYRDLNDAPRAIEKFHKSIEVIKDNANCDSILLMNTYSNLFYIFSNVQDLKNALRMAQKEYFYLKN